MWIPEDLGWMAKRLNSGYRVNRITVRDLLLMFKAERRGLNKVHDIRAALGSLGLITDPDFESEWIDAKIRIRLKDDSNAQTQVHTSTTTAGDAPPDSPSAAEVPEPAPIVVSSEGDGVLETKLSGSPDPTFRIGSLPASNKPLVTVGQDDPLTKAVTKMLQYDLSQLPIMHGEREVKGMISWKSIASRYALGGECCKVQHCREDAQLVDGNGTLFDAIPTIVKHGYVLVRSHDRRITGIVTASDLSLQFQQLAEPFLLLREIELHIRDLLRDKVTTEDLAILASPDRGAVTPRSVLDLTLGGYVRLLQRTEIWSKLALNIDQDAMTSELDAVRLIRNDVMHFDPDPMTQDQLDTLKRAAKFMQQLYELLP